MKKEYINPEMEIVNIQITQQMLAGSIDTVNPGETVTPGTEDAPSFFGGDSEDW